MKAFVKTLVGDARNLGVVAAILAAGAGLAFSGQPLAAWLATPVLTLVGVAWLARH